MIIQELSQEECFAAIAETRLARLGCAFGGQPYVVPVYLAHAQSSSGEHLLYGFTSPGQKIDWMRVNPLVCVEWDAVEDFDKWTSVIAFGRYEELPATSCAEPATRSPEGATPSRIEIKDGEQELARAQQLLQSHALWWQPGYAAFVNRAEHGGRIPYTIVYYRIRVEKITGHRATPKDESTSRRS